MNQAEKHVWMDILSAQAEENASVINFIESYEIDSIEAVQSSYIVRGVSDRNWVYLIINHPNDLEAIQNALNAQDRNFAMIQDTFAKEIIQDRPLQWILSCNKFVYPNESSLPNVQLEKEGAVLRPLKPSEAGFIFENYEYKSFTTPEYIEDRVTQGLSFGIEVDGQLVAWLLTHDDGAMGLLTVLDAYRKNGFAAVLTIEMIKALRSQNKIPFVAIEPSNIKSLSLAKKFGFVDRGLYHWFEI